MLNLRIMSLLRFLLGLAFAVALAASPAVIQALGRETDALAPRQVRGLDGRTIRLAAPEGGVLALVFYSTECPISNASSPTLNAFVKKFPSERCQLVGLCVDPDVDEAKIAGHAKEYGLTFPVARDADLAVAHAYGIKVTPEVVVLDETGEVRYQGRIDDQFAARLKKNQNPLSHELRDAIAAVLAGHEVAAVEVAADRLPAARDGRRRVEAGHVHQGRRPDPPEELPGVPPQWETRAVCAGDLRAGP